MKVFGLTNSLFFVKILFFVCFVRVFFPTQHNKLRCSLHNSKWVFELNFYFPCVRPQAVSEQQAAVIGFPGNLDPSSVFDLRAVSKPAHHQRLLGSKGHLESGILTNSYDHRFGELVKVIRVKLGHICAKHSPISLSTQEIPQNVLYIRTTACNITSNS